MDGIIIVDKPKDYTSRDIVNIISKKLHTKKVGHTGTLDPNATGVLVLCIGKATKLVDLLTSTYKEYIAEVTLGIKTDTLDSMGIVLEKKDVSINNTDILKALDNFKGKYMQEVPLYSAVKINGMKLYEYARNDIHVELPKREVEIKEIELLNIKNNIFTFRTVVSKGTYIRSLVKDICTSLNTIGMMSNLRRVKQGTFDIKDAYTLDDILNDNYKITSIEDALSNIYKVDMDDELYKKVSNGVKLDNIYNKDMVLFKYNGHVVALYKNDNNILKMYKMFN